MPITAQNELMRRIPHRDPADVPVTELMYALSDPARARIVGLLARARTPLTCGEISAGRPKSTMSHHFRILREAGVIETEVQGKEHLNRLRREELEERYPGLISPLLKALRDED